MTWNSPDPSLIVVAILLLIAASMMEEPTGPQWPSSTESHAINNPTDLDHQPVQPPYSPLEP